MSRPNPHQELRRLVREHGIAAVLRAVADVTGHVAINGLFNKPADFGDEQWGRLMGGLRQLDGAINSIAKHLPLDYKPDLR